MTSLRLQNVKKSYEHVNVIHGIDLTINSGEFVVFVGPSGCGKSTLLRMIAGLEEISSGQLLIEGQDMTQQPATERGIAMVFQSYALYPNMTVRGNLAYPLEVMKKSKAEINQAIAQTAARLHLTELLDRLPRALSGGQRQRVAMGRAMVRNPQVFLFDEPLSNLDAQLRMELRAEIKSLHQRFKTTMVYVTHDQVEAMTLADQIVVMKDGVIVQQGAPLAIYDRPVNTFVARFIGSPPMNLLDARFEVRDAVPGVCCGEQWLRLPSRWHRAAQQQAGQPVTLGVRPHDLVTDVSGQPATVNIVEITGESTLLHLAWQGFLLHMQLSGRSDAVPGGTLPVTVNPDKMHLFDAVSGERLTEA